MARLRGALDHSLNFSKRYEVEGAYLLVGVDKLTMVTQALRHEAADAVLLAIGDRLDRCLRASDVIGRVGGDRFGAVLSNVPEADVEAATGKVLDAIRNTPIDTPEGPVDATVSIGAVPFPGAINTAQDVMMRGRGPAESQAARPLLYLHIYVLTGVERASQILHRHRRAGSTRIAGKTPALRLSAHR